jgi:hypothetical protein
VGLELGDYAMNTATLVMTGATHPATPMTQAEASSVWQHMGAWRANPTIAVSCPRCSHEGLGIEDRSARPYAEWYAISCHSCGLEHTLHVALGMPPAGGAG